MNQRSPLPPLADARDRQARSVSVRAVKDMVRKALDLDDGTAVFVAEISCGEIDCPDLETVIAYFVGAERREFRLPGGIPAITGADIAAAIARRPALMRETPDSSTSTKEKDHEA